jgi:hypothetical protein
MPQGLKLFLCSALVRNVLAEDHTPRRQPDNLHIQPEGPVMEVPGIQLHLRRYGNLITPVDLCRPEVKLNLKPK